MPKSKSEIIIDALEDNFGLVCELGEGPTLMTCERGDIELAIFKPTEPGGNYRATGRRVVEDQILISDEPTGTLAAEAMVDIYATLHTLEQETDRLERESARKFKQIRNQ